MTEDSAGGTQRYGPFEEGAEPTEPAPIDPFGYDAETAGSNPPQPTPPYSAAPPPSSPHAAAPSGMNPPGAHPSATAGRASDPYDFSVSTPFGGRRIEPSPPPDRSRLVIGIVAGLVAGLLIFGTGGWLAGRATAPGAPAAPRTTSKADSKTDPNGGSKTGPAGSLGVFEQRQVVLNQPHFATTGLVAISRGWLPYLSGCVRSGEPGGPVLNSGERNRVRCTLNGMSAFFVEYTSIAGRDEARAKTLDQNSGARTLTPGVGAASRGPTASGRTNGNYVEYAYKITEGGVTRTVAAIWWDDAQTPVAGYLLAYWKEGLGESWEPLRDLWARYA